jgi:GMP synthase-like glutamine amidotransferase
MKIALLDFHRKKNDKILETYKIRDALTVNATVEIDIFEMLDGKAGEVRLDKYNALVLSGSDSNHLERYPGYRITKNLLEEAKKQDMPVLGICAGFQILAKIFGYELEMMETGPEMGWYEIFLSDDGKQDPLFKNMPEQFISFLCHIKRIHSNSQYNTTTVLAYNNNCLQSFKFGKNMYGIQFHPEDTIEGGEELIDRYRRRPPTRQNSVTAPSTLYGSNIFKNFVSIAESYNNPTAVK